MAGKLQVLAAFSLHLCRICSSSLLGSCPLLQKPCFAAAFICFFALESYPLVQDPTNIFPATIKCFNPCRSMAFLHSVFFIASGILISFGSHLSSVFQPVQPSQKLPALFSSNSVPYSDSCLSFIFQPARFLSFVHILVHPSPAGSLQVPIPIPKIQGHMSQVVLHSLSAWGDDKCPHIPAVSS